ncbi:MAG: hypothetical protein GX811_12825 [Lentisphaerae bacterium]|nr:hypothetical protein [Lentisphaerota bacterium]
MKFKWLILITAMMALVLPVHADIDFAPFFSVDTDIHGQSRIRVLGPLFEFKSSETNKSVWALRPLTSFAEHGYDNKTERDVLWPLWTGKTFNDEYSWQCVLLVRWQDFDVTDPESRYRFWALPFYFQGRSAKGEDYKAVFPLGGEIQEFIGRDSIKFVMFPIYTYTTINDVETVSYIWPIFARTTGHGHDRFRAFPIYGYARLREDFMKKFILWPFWTSAEYNYAGANGSAFILFPFYGETKMENQEAKMYLPPFFKFARSEDQGAILCLWPFYQRKWNQHKDQLDIWPLYGSKQQGHLNNKYFLWPIVRTEKAEYDNRELNSFSLIPLIESKTKVIKNSEEPEDDYVEGRFFKLWPLFSYSRSNDDLQFKTFRLWPFKDFDPIERNYAPFWTLYSHTRQGDIVEDELLWGLFQHRRGGVNGRKISLFPFFSVGKNDINETLEWDFLKGLFGYKRNSSGKRVKLLYLFSFGSAGAD